MAASHGRVTGAKSASVQTLKCDSPADLLARINRTAPASKASPMPPGAKTACQWAEVWGICDSMARQTIRRAIDAGIMEPVKYTIRRVNGSGMTLTAYREKR
jgi:hypothetical protein